MQAPPPYPTLPRHTHRHTRARPHTLPRRMTHVDERIPAGRPPPPKTKKKKSISQEKSVAAMFLTHVCSCTGGLLWFHADIFQLSLPVYCMPPVLGPNSTSSPPPVSSVLCSAAGRARLCSATVFFRHNHANPEVFFFLERAVNFCLRIKKKKKERKCQSQQRPAEPGGTLSSGDSRAS